MSWKQVEDKLKTSQKTSFRRIAFRLGTHQSSSSSSATLIAKYSTQNSSTNKVVKNGEEDAVSGPSPGLFDPAKLIPFLVWSKIFRNAPGLFNNGNTCYLNSTLQCLLHIPALTQYILQDTKASASSSSSSSQEIHHTRSIYELYQNLCVEIWTHSSGKAISPRGIVQSLRRIGKHFRPMRQEDAHEFLRYFLDSMHEEMLRANGLKSSSSDKIVNTTLIGRVFGGYLRNEMCCSVCAHKSRTYNAFQDLSLDITASRNSLNECIKAFTRPETLGKGNEWMCEKCKRKVQVHLLCLLNQFSRITMNNAILE